MNEIDAVKKIAAEIYERHLWGPHMVIDIPSGLPIETLAKIGEHTHVFGPDGRCRFFFRFEPDPATHPCPIVRVEGETPNPDDYPEPKSRTIMA